jgi:hypothetical protein
MKRRQILILTAAVPVGAVLAPATAQAGPTPKPDLTLHGIPIDDYQTVFDHATAAGYELVWFDGYELAEQGTFVNVILRPADGVPWQASHGMTGDEYQGRFDDLGARGYRLVHVASYLYRRQVRYAGIWRKESGPLWVAYHGYQHVDHQPKFDDLVQQGYHPVNISVVSPAGVPEYTALYRRESVGLFAAESFITPNDYQLAWNNHTTEGRQLSYLCACQHLGGVRFSAIFQEILPGSGGVYGQHGLGSAAFQTTLQAQVAAGFLTRVVAGYEQGGAATFAGAWRRP